MKIRNGFVSNSSTTSFCIYGCHIDREDEDKAIELDLEIHLDGFDYVYAGRSLTSIRGNETGLEFKHSVDEKIKQINPKYKCDLIEKSFYDG